MCKCGLTWQHISDIARDKSRLIDKSTGILKIYAKINWSKKAASAKTLEQE